MRINVPDHIENPARYIAAAEARIKANGRPKREARWLAAHPDGQRLKNWLFGWGEFEGRDRDGYLDEHPLCRGMYSGDFGAFLLKLRDDLQDWGQLTEKQTQIVRNALAKREGWAAERAKENAEKRAQDAATSQWIGEEGERREFELEVQWMKVFSGQFGATYIHGMKDPAGNVVIYKGSNCLGSKGNKVKVKASIKAHEEREGVRQTLIARPKLIEGDVSVEG